MELGGVITKLRTMVFFVVATLMFFMATNDDQAPAKVPEKLRLRLQLDDVYGIVACMEHRCYAKCNKYFGEQTH